MSVHSRVVPFRRSPAYVHQRALLNKRENNLIDALGLMRRAVEQAPDNKQYRLALADLLREMGCHEQSNRLLLDLLAQKDAPSECLYELALNRMYRMDQPGAKRALRLYKLREPELAHSEAVAALEDELNFMGAQDFSFPRQVRRVQGIAERAAEAMKEADYQRAGRLFDRCFALGTDRADIYALSGMNFAMIGKPDAALERLKKAKETPDPDIRTRCVIAQTYQMTGHPDKSIAEIRLAMQEDLNLMEQRLLIYTASELKAHDILLELTRKALFLAPHDRTLLHIRAVALIESGQDVRRAARLWTHIMRLDPEDTIAQYYRELVSSGGIAKSDLSYAYQVPPAEYARRLNTIASELSASAEELTQKWKDNLRFRLLLKWCTTIPNESFQRAAVAVLAALEDEDAVSTLREYLSRSDVPTSLKLQASMVLNMRGADINAFLPTQETVESILDNCDDLFAAWSVSIRQMVRWADEVLAYHHGISALSELAMLWSEFDAAYPLPGLPAQDANTMAAALTATYLTELNETVDYTALSRAFECSERQVRYVTRRMLHTLGIPDNN